MESTLLALAGHVDVPTRVIVLEPLDLRLS